MKNMRNVTIDDALDCINIMKAENSLYCKDYKIGRLKKDLYGMVGKVSGFPGYTKGSIVLYRPGSVENEVTIEIPLSKDEITERKANNNFIRTIGTMVCVPKSYIGELNMLQKIAILFKLPAGACIP